MIFDAISGLLNLAKPVVESYFPDETKRQEFVRDISKHLQDSDKAQLGVYIEQLKHTEGRPLWYAFYHTGWRPLASWTGVIVIMVNTLGIYIANNVFSQTWLPIDGGVFDTVVLGTLGLAGIRSFDKKKGLTKI